MLRACFSNEDMHPDFSDDECLRWRQVPLSMVGTSSPVFSSLVVVDCSQWAWRATVRTELSFPPILENKRPSSPSVFLPPALLREARRQKRLPVADVPPICILDPDGDIVRR